VRTRREQKGRGDAGEEGKKKCAKEGIVKGGGRVSKRGGALGGGAEFVLLG